MTTGLFIGRFQPFHLGHLATVRFALNHVRYLVIVVGSAQKSHEARNPFTAGERIQMIKLSLDSDAKIESNRVLIIPVPDADIHRLWTHQVDMLVPKYDVVFTNDPFSSLLFHERGIKVVQAPLVRRKELAATEIRKKMILGEDWNKLVPKQVAAVIKEINGLERLREIERKELPARKGNH